MLNGSRGQKAREKLPGLKSYRLKFHISLTFRKSIKHYLSANFNKKINFMKIKGLLLVASVLSILSACSQTNVGNIKLETKEDSLAYAIGVSTYRGVTEAGWEIDPMIMAKAMIDAKEGTPVFDEIAAQGFLAVYSQQKQEEMAREQYADVIEEGEKFLKENADKEGVLVTESGLQYKVLVMGDGAMPKAEDKVRVHYTGTLTDGTLFDSSVERGEPSEFMANRVIQGWTEGLQLMPVGSKFMFYIPSELAYGSRGAGATIKPFSTLVFEVELLDIISPEE